MKSMKRMFMAFAMMAISASALAASVPITPAPEYQAAGASWSAPSHAIAQPVAAIAAADASAQVVKAVTDKGKAREPSPLRGTLAALSSGVLVGTALMFIVTSPTANASTLDPGSEDVERLWAKSTSA